MPASRLLEIMREAAGELAHRFHLLRLAERGLGVLALLERLADAAASSVLIELSCRARSAWTRSETSLNRTATW